MIRFIIKPYQPRPTLTWNPLTGAATYDVEVYNNSTFTAPKITGITGLSVASWVVSPALQNGNTYYWRVIAKDALGNDGGLVNSC